MPFCLLEPPLRRWPRSVILGAGAATAGGCPLRPGLPFVPHEPQSHGEVIAGTSASARRSPFPVHAAAVIGDVVGADERALATAIAINFNQVGIATAFLVGGSMATDAAGLTQYFSVISVASLS